MAKKIVKVPIDGYMLENTSDKTNKGAYVNISYDNIIDVLKINSSRPGLECKYYDTTTGIINGLFFWEAKETVVAVINGVPYAVSIAANDIYTLYDISTAGEILDTTNKVYFAGNSDYLIMANGGRMVVWNGNVLSPSVYVTDADAPTEVDMVAYLDNYILAMNFESSKFYFSDATAGISSPTTWSGDYYSFESKADIGSGIIVANSLVYGFSKYSIEVWYNDSTPFSRMSGGVIDSGCTYGDTIKEMDGIIYYLGSDNHIYALQNTSFQSISILIDNELSKLDFTGANADVVDVDGLKYYILNIPAEEESYVYSITNNGWVKWSKYIESDRTEFPGRYFIKRNGKNLGVDTENIAIYELNPDMTIDDKIEEEILSSFYIDSDLAAGIEPYDGITLQMDAGAHDYLGKAIFRANSDENTFDVSYGSNFDTENLVATRSETDNSENLNKKYTLLCVSPGTGSSATLGEFKFTSDASGSVYREVYFEKSSPVATNDYPFYYYSDIVVELYHPYTGPLGSTVTFTKAAGGIASSTGSFPVDNIKSITFGSGAATTYTIEVTVKSNINVFQLLRLNSNKIVFNKRTSWFDHGTSNYKISRFLKMKLNREYINYINPGAAFEIRYRDNGGDRWSNWMQVELKVDADGFYSYLKNLGRYMSRQYEIRCLYPIKFSIDTMEELIDVTNRKM